MKTSITHPTLRTPEQVLAWFRANGIGIASWCRENGHSRNVVNALLYKNFPGKQGKSHRAAVALGLKAAPEQALQQAQVGETNE
jgi:gp16 family phage-associated protein